MAIGESRTHHVSPLASCAFKAISVMKNKESFVSFADDSFLSEIMTMRTHQRLCLGVRMRSSVKVRLDIGSYAPEVICT